MGMQTIRIREKESYLAMIRGADGSALFQHIYADVDGVLTDILEDGNLSCAYFVSSVLTVRKLIREMHARTESTVRDMLASGWSETDTLAPGVVVVWEESTQGKHRVPHIGFALGEDEAMSNKWEEKSPRRHHITFGENPDGTPVRRIVALYTHPILAS